ncbi:Dual specificity phosphatase, catalytic domain [compost metagenome]
MIEIHPNLHVGSEVDEREVRGRSDWFVVHACKEPYHRQALGYTGRAAAKDHPEYLIARRPGRLILNLVDVDNVNYIGAELVDAGLEAIHSHLETHKVLVHCNQGVSRSPTIAFLYLSKYTDRFSGLDHAQALEAFKEFYPPYDPGKGMADYARINWPSYS